LNTAATKPELVIVMPAYNEEGCIVKVVGKWLGVFSVLGVQDGKLVVVNDGSKDKTGDLLDELAKNNSNLIVCHQANGGHGKALLTAYSKALELAPRWVFHVDSDDQFDPNDLKTLWEKRRESSFITGYRKSRHDAFHRLVITKILVCINLAFFGKHLKDANIPFRLIEGGYLRRLLRLLPATVFAPNIFLAVLAARDGQNLMEIPIHHADRSTGKVSIVKMRLIKACMRSAKELFIFSLTLRQKLRMLNQDVQ